MTTNQPTPERYPNLQALLEGRAGARKVAEWPLIIPEVRALLDENQRLRAAKRETAEKFIDFAKAIRDQAVEDERVR